VKILVTGFEWFGDLVPFVVRALSDLGHTAAPFATNRDLLIRRRAGLLRGLERIPFAGGSAAGRLRTKLAHEGEVLINAAFRQEIDRFRPDVVLSILCWGEPLAPESLAYASGAVRIGWLMDDPFGYEASRLDTLLQSFDRLFSVDDGWGDNVERMIGRRPEWLPCGADPHSHGPSGCGEIEPDLNGTIVFVGSSCIGHPTGVYRQALLASLEGLPVAVFGDTGWISAGSRVPNFYRGGPVCSERANRIYASAAIALNFHHPQFRRGTSLRTFALCCSGAFQVADWREGLDCWLRPGVELETFRTPHELRALAERYLSDAPGRRRIAAAGRARVLAEHTYRHRMETMLAHAQ
jgi:Glycosyl transferases group 1